MDGKLFDKSLCLEAPKPRAVRGVLTKPPTEGRRTLEGSGAAWPEAVAAAAAAAGVASPDKVKGNDGVEPVRDEVATVVVVARAEGMAGVVAGRAS